MRRFTAAIALLAPLASWAVQPSVAIDLNALDEAAFQRLDAVGLEKSATVRLVQEGFAVVSPSAGPAVVLRVTLLEGPARVALLATGPGGESGREVPWGDGPLPELHLELVQKMVELARAAAKEPERPRLQIVERPPPPPPPQPTRFAVLGSLGAEVHAGGVEPQARLWFRYGEKWRLAVDTGVGAGRGKDVNVLDARVAAGPALALLTSEAFDLEVGATLGALAQGFSFDDGTAKAGVDLLGAIPVTLVARPAQRLSLAFRLCAGASTSHPVERIDYIAWNRGALFVEAGLALALRL